MRKAGEMSEEIAEKPDDDIDRTQDGEKNGSNNRDRTFRCREEQCDELSRGHGILLY